MSSNRLRELLADATIPDSSAARERTVADARAERPPAGAAGRVRPVRRRPRRALAFASVAALVAALLLTPPGRSALSQAAEALGVAGESPTLEQRVPGLDAARAPGQRGAPTIVDDGEAPDGTRYEWVAYRGAPLSPAPSDSADPPPASKPSVCLTFEWPDAPWRHNSGGCASAGGFALGKITSFVTRLLRPREAGAPRGARDFMLTGTLAPRVHDLRIRYRRPGGGVERLPVDMARVDGTLLRQVGRARPFSTFVAFIPGETVRRDRLTERYSIASLSPVEASKPMPPLDDPISRCARRANGPPRRGWVDFLLYDADGDRIATIPTRTSEPPPAHCWRRGLPRDG